MFAIALSDSSHIYFLYFTFGLACLLWKVMDLQSNDIHELYVTLQTQNPVCTYHAYSVIDN